MIRETHITVETNSIWWWVGVGAMDNEAPILVAFCRLQATSVRPTYPPKKR